MPYIPKEDRLNLKESSNLTEGELNYLITRLLNDQINRKGLKYATINSLIGTLECAKLELYRRIAGPYEDKAVERNGDVYDS